MTEKEHDVDYKDPEEETKGTWEKKVCLHFNSNSNIQVDLPEVKKVTGEENEECIFKMRAKIYRMRDDQWKERGTGNAKLLRHKENKKIRFLLR